MKTGKIWPFISLLLSFFLVGMSINANAATHVYDWCECATYFGKEYSHTDTFYRYYKNVQHMHEVEMYNRYQCLRCGKIREPVGGPGPSDSYWEDHDFVNGVCVCGYTQPSSATATPKPVTPAPTDTPKPVTPAPGICSHPSAALATTKIYTTYEPQAGDDQRHRVVNHNQVTCTKCGTVVKNDEIEYQVALHDFGGGSTCSKCGYSKAGYYMSVDQGHINGLAAYVGGGQGATINVTSNVGWTATTDDNWIHIYNMTGNGNGRFSVYVDANNGYAREGHILLVGTHGATIDIKVSQEGAIVNPETCEHNFVHDYNNQVSGTGKWKKVNDTYHIRESLEFIEFCSKCGAQQQVRREDTGAANEKHTFGATSWTRWMSNEKKHSRNGKKTCTAPGCGLVVNVKETDEHSFVDGKCVCGKKAPSWQEVWEHVDKNIPLINIRLDSAPLYLFESFVEEYRGSTYEQAWTAALSSIDIAKETLPEALKLIEGHTEDLVALFSSDEKVARLIIDYLATSDFSALLESHEGVSELQGVFEFVEEPLSYLDIKYATVRSVETQTEFMLGDLMNITDKNCKDVYKQLMSIRNANGTVDFSDPSIVELVYVDTSCKLGDRVQEKLGRIIEESGDDTYVGEIPGSPGRKILTAAEVVSYILTPVLSGVDAYSEFAKYQAVLDQYESDLTAILEGAGSDNAKHIIEEVMDTLTETVVDGLVLSIEKEMFADTTAATIEIIADVSFIPLAVVDVETMILGIAANTSETFGKVWSVEDLYTEFQTAEKNLLKAVKTFHSSPSDGTYSQLEAELAYYSLLVGSGANAVSSILINDAEAPVNMFKNWVGGFFDGAKVDYRIEQIKYANKLPAEDQATLDGVKALIIP